MFWFNDLKVYYNKTILLEAEKEIVAMIAANEFVVICYDPEIIPNNIVCLNQEGKELWRLAGISAFVYNQVESFNSMRLEADIITSYNLAGYLCQIDIHTGKIINQDFIR